MNVKSIVAAAFATLFFATVAQAVTITNNDGKEHKLTVFEGENNKDILIKPGQTLEGLCATKCSVRVNDDEDNEYELEVEEKISIEDNLFIYMGDDQEQGSSPDFETENQDTTTEEK